MSLEFYIFDPSFDIVGALKDEAKNLSIPGKRRFKPYIIRVAQSLRRSDALRKTFDSNEPLDTIIAGLFVSFFSTYILVNGRVKKIPDPGKQFYLFVCDQIKGSNNINNKYIKKRDYIEKYLLSLIDPVGSTIESYMNIRTALTALKQIK